LSLLVVLLAGCHHATAPALKAAVPPALGTSGWTAASDAETGVSLGVPPGWRVGVPRAFDPASLSGSSLAGSGEGGDPSAPSANVAVQGMMDDMAKQSAAAEKATLAKLREKEGIVLHCVDGSKPIVAEEPTRFYVRFLKDAGYGTLDEAAAEEKSQSHQDMKIEKVSLPVGKAARLQVKGRNRIGDEECRVSYVFVDGKDAYVLRFASTNAPDAVLGIDRQVAETFRVAKK